MSQEEQFGLTVNKSEAERRDRLKNSYSRGLGVATIIGAPWASIEILEYAMGRFLETERDIRIADVEGVINGLELRREKTGTDLVAYEIEDVFYLDGVVYKEVGPTATTTYTALIEEQNQSIEAIRAEDYTMKTIVGSTVGGVLLGATILGVAFYFNFKDVCDRLGEKYYAFLHKPKTIKPE